MKLFTNIFIYILIVFSSCSKDDETITPVLDNGNPIVKSSSTYDVNFDEDLVYAQGLSHQSINSSNATPIPLKLDIYYPENNSTNRPVYLFIHGGGFTMGDKQDAFLPDIANYYASRGWVFISINYRLRDDFGTVPQEWLDFANTLPSNARSIIIAQYPPMRDAKAAMRWVIANAATYNINTDFITVGGGSAGAMTAITTGISEPEDYRDELSVTQDPTLSTTNLNQNFKVETIIDFWGSKANLDVFELVYGNQRFDSNDPSMLIVHGTNDTTVPFSNAVDLKTICETNSIPHAFYPLQGQGHSAWNATVNGKSLEELAFDFIVEQQELNVE